VSRTAHVRATLRPLGGRHTEQGQFAADDARFLQWKTLLLGTRKRHKEQGVAIGGRAVTLGSHQEGVSHVLHEMVDHASGAKGSSFACPRHARTSERCIACPRHARTSERCIACPRHARTSERCVVEGFDTEWSTGAPWVLRSNKSGCGVHNDLTDNRITPGRGSNLWSLLVCLHATKRYTFRIYARSTPFERTADLEAAPHTDYKIQTGSWVLFPARQQHQVLHSGARVILNMVFSRM
jgi:hypothetical protein